MARQARQQEERYQRAWQAAKGSFLTNKNVPAALASALWQDLDVNVKRIGQQLQELQMQQTILDGYRRRLFALRQAARYRHPTTGARHFAHDKVYRAAFVRGILEHRAAIRRLEKQQ
jgi:hypothetical protein